MAQRLTARSVIHPIVTPLTCTFLHSPIHSAHELPCVIHVTNVSWVVAGCQTLRRHTSSEPTHSITMLPKTRHPLL